MTKERKGQEEEEQWDKYLVTKLSDVTARWIAEKKVRPFFTIFIWMSACQKPHIMIFDENEIFTEMYF